MELDANHPEKTSLTRNELYELVWSTPMKRLAKQFGLSDVGLAKICKRHHIPRPERGYWAKKAHGKRVTKRRLPEVDNPGLQTVCLTGDVEPKEATIASYFDPEIQRLADGEANPVNAIIVRDALYRPHPLVVRTRDILRSAKTDSEGFVSSRREEALWIQVGKPNVGRALRILDAFVKALEARGFEVRQSAAQFKRDLCIVWKSHELDFRIREKLERHAHVLTEKERQDKARFRFSFAPKWDFTLTGRLELEVQGMAVQDGKKVRVEEMLHKLFLKIYHRLDDWERTSFEMAQRKELERAHEEERLRRERRKQRRRKRLNQLLVEAQAWHQAELIRCYVREVVPLSDLEHANQGTWAMWALRQADALDPRLRRRDFLHRSSYVDS